MGVRTTKIVTTSISVTCHLYNLQTVYANWGEDKNIPDLIQVVLRTQQTSATRQSCTVAGHQTKSVNILALTAISTSRQRC